MNINWKKEFESELNAYTKDYDDFCECLKTDNWNNFKNELNILSTKCDEYSSFIDKVLKHFESGRYYDYIRNYNSDIYNLCNYINECDTEEEQNKISIDLSTFIERFNNVSCYKLIENGYNYLIFLFILFKNPMKWIKGNYILKDNLCERAKISFNERNFYKNDKVVDDLSEYVYYFNIDYYITYHEKRVAFYNLKYIDKDDYCDRFFYLNGSLLKEMAKYLVNNEFSSIIDFFIRFVYFKFKVDLSDNLKEFKILFEYTDEEIMVDDNKFYNDKRTKMYEKKLEEDSVAKQKMYEEYLEERRQEEEYQEAKRRKIEKDNEYRRREEERENWKKEKQREDMVRRANENCELCAQWFGCRLKGHLTGPCASFRKKDEV